MSIEIKCDRCGKPVPAEGEGIYTSRVTPANIIITKNGRGEMHDLCDDCLEKLDIFMSGKMPVFDYTGELAYLELPNPNVYVCEQNALTGTGLERGSEINISAKLEHFNRLIDGYGITDLPLCAVRKVILGVKLR